jgi:hypothetical protein
MREKAWNSFCRDCKLALRDLNFATMDLIFITKCKEAGTNGLSFDVFLETLSAFAQLRYRSDSVTSLKRDLQVLQHSFTIQSYHAHTPPPAAAAQ